MIEIKNLRKRFGELEVLRGVSLTVHPGQFVAILGQSGAGKSTLMRCLNRLEVPTSGEIFVDGIDVTDPQCAVRELRRRVGFIFQHHNVVLRSSVLRNVLHGCSTSVSQVASLFNVYPRSAVESALACIAQVELGPKVHSKVQDLSGGQRQRVGIARALAQNPTVMLADEPVSSLDPKTARSVMQCLRAISTSRGLTAICNLHQVDLAVEYCERVIGVAHGEVVYDGPARDLTSTVLREIYPGAELDFDHQLEHVRAARIAAAVEPTMKVG